MHRRSSFNQQSFSSNKLPLSLHKQYLAYLGNLLCFQYFICENPVCPGTSASLLLLQRHEPSLSDPEVFADVSGAMAQLASHVTSL